MAAENADIRHMNGTTVIPTSRKHQTGMTTLGLVILALFIGIFAFAFLRLIPVYLNYMKIVGVIDGVHEEFDSQKPTISAIKTSIRRRFNVDSVGVITPRDVKVTTVEGGYSVSAVYDHTAPFISNIYFTVKFDKSVVVRR